MLDIILEKIERGEYQGINKIEKLFFSYYEVVTNNGGSIRILFDKKLLKRNKFEIGVFRKEREKYKVIQYFIIKSSSDDYKKAKEIYEIIEKEYEEECLKYI